MTNPAGIPGDRICAFVERVERIDEEIKELNEGKKEVFAEAKGEGFDVKVLKETPNPIWGIPTRDGSRLAFVDQSASTNVWVAQATTP